FRIEILPAALRDAEEAYLWYRENAPGRAAQWWNGLVEAIFSLEEFRHRCSPAPESEDLQIEIRQLLFGQGPGTYRIYFRIIGEDVVRILRIRHGARDRLSPEEVEPRDEGT